jgi:hypothetical protein
MSGEQIGLNITLIAIVVFVGLVAFLWRQQKTIDRLTDKLLGIQPTPKIKKGDIVEEDASPKEEDPKGWFDH